MYWVMISSRYFLARRDIVRESSSFCSKLSSAVRRLYLRSCEKTMLSFHLSEWLEWKCRSAKQSVGFLYSAVESLRSALMWIFMSRKGNCWVECWKVNLILEWRWFMKSCKDWRWLLVPRKIRKMSSKNLFQKRIAQIKASWFLHGSPWEGWHMVGWLGSHVCVDQLEKMLIQEWKVISLRMVSSNIPIVWGLGAPGGRVYIYWYIWMKKSKGMLNFLCINKYTDGRMVEYTRRESTLSGGI